MAKPICVMYIPHNYGSWEPNLLMEILNGFNGSDAEITNKITITDYWADYYWFCFHKDDITEPALQVFCEKDFTPIKFEELKNFIEDAISQSKEKA